jgi:hypothetical protein
VVVDEEKFNFFRFVLFHLISISHFLQT